MSTQSRFNFPGGEVSVNIRSALHIIYENKKVSIRAIIRSSDDFMALAMEVDAVRRLYGSSTRIEVKMPYVPYARQDRVMLRGEALGIKVMCDMINSLKLDLIEILDPHSDVTPALLNNCVVVKQENIFVNEVTCNTIVSPDAGARKKADSLSKLSQSPVIYAEKVRDVATGEISHTSVYVDPLVHFPGDLIIVDDICDGGRTFVELAKALRAHDRFQQEKRIGLCVTHGIFSKGVEAVLQDGLINYIVTANPWPNVPKLHPLVKIL